MFFVQLFVIKMSNGKRGKNGRKKKDIIRVLEGPDTWEEQLPDNHCKLFSFSNTSFLKSSLKFATYINSSKFIQFLKVSLPCVANTKYDDSCTILRSVSEAIGAVPVRG